jgi:hypothetical protein
MQSGTKNRFIGGLRQTNNNTSHMKKLFFRVSAVFAAEVFAYNTTFHIDRNQRLYVNQIRRPTPFYYPNIRSVLVAVRQYGGDTHIETDFKLKVTFRYGQLCVTVPKIEPFLGNETLCGLAGNIDDNCLNDLLLRYVKFIIIYTSGNILQYEDLRPIYIERK